jgi:hypothetical protein
MDDGFRSGSATRVMQFGNVDPVGPFGGCPLLEHGFLCDALDETLEDHRPAGDPAQRPLRDGQVVVDEVELGVRARPAVAFEYHLVRMGDGDLVPGHFQ